MNTHTLLTIVLSLSLLGCGGKEEDSGGGDDGDGSTTDQTGDELFQKCAGCHGANGEGSIGPSLVDKIPTLDDDALMDVLMNGKGEMAPVALNEAEEDVLFNWLRDRFGQYGGG